ncbi:phage integrase N-terminal SAM-like domain-containing protein [Roseiflexus castenholzii]|uniref:phage integrase N-terminal SAM-like domain-containing protein n=1 Tax=Roseiflexus castenholzii TaxID=120962 RepID=UPI003C7DE093
MSSSGHPPRLLDPVRGALRRKHYSLRTEEAYIGWVRWFIRFHNLRHPREMGSREIGAFLTSLAVEEEVAASTQNQALSALLFLYREVLPIERDADLSIPPAKRPQYLPAVLSRAEVRDVLAALSGTHQLMAQLLYGSGLRLLECLRLRVKDLDGEQPN